MAATASPPLGASFWQRLNGLRGVLSLYVMVHHAVQLLWPSWEEVASARPALGLPAHVGSVTLHFGVHAVLVFFVVSGVSIHARVAERRVDAPFEVADYARRRLRRLYPALLFSLVISAVLGALAHVPELTWTNLLGTLLFQQQLFFPMFAGNVPYWSLSFEGYYYVLYPAFLALYRRQGTRVYVTFVTVALVAGWLGGALATVATLYPVWLAGAALIDLRVAGVRLPRSVVAGLALLFAAAIPHYLWFGLDAASSTLPWLAFGIGAVGLVEGWVRAAWLDRVPARVLDAAGEMSYSLYLNHYLVFLLLGAWFHPSVGQLWRSAALTIVGSAVSVGLAAISYYGIERRFLRPRSATMALAA